MAAEGRRQLVEREALFERSEPNDVRSEDSVLVS